MATVAYLRVSKESQDLEKNKADILMLANEKNLGHVQFVEEKISGRVSWKKRKIYSVMQEAVSGDVLIVSEHARIMGNVHCATLIVEGYISGDVHATELLELQPKGRIIGNVHYKRLEMHSGATVAGTLTHQESGEPEFHLAMSPPSIFKVSEA